MLIFSIFSIAVYFLLNDWFWTEKENELNYLWEIYDHNPVHRPFLAR